MSRAGRFRALTGLVAVGVAGAMLWAQEPSLARQVDPSRVRGFPLQVNQVGAVLRPGMTLVLVQDYVATGIVAGIGLYSRDAALVHDVETALPERTQLVFVRRVVHVDPLRTVALARPSGFVTVLGLSSHRRNRRLYWYAQLRAVRCLPVGIAGPGIAVWQCPSKPGARSTGAAS